MRETYFHIRYLFGRENVWTAVEALLQHDRCGYVVVADGVVLTRVQRDLSFRKVVHDSLFAICDSSWVPLYIKAIYGRKREQYCGFDLIDGWFAAVSEVSHDVFGERCFDVGGYSAPVG